MAKVKSKVKMIKYWVSGVYYEPGGNGAWVEERWNQMVVSAPQGHAVIEAKSVQEAHEKILADIPLNYRKRIVGRIVYAYGRCGHPTQRRLMHVLEDKDGERVYEYHLDEVGGPRLYLSGEGMRWRKSRPGDPDYRVVQNEDKKQKGQE